MRRRRFGGRGEQVLHRRRFGLAMHGSLPALPRSRARVTSEAVQLRLGRWTVRFHSLFYAVLQNQRSEYRHTRKKEVSLRGRRDESPGAGRCPAKPVLG